MPPESPPPNPYAAPSAALGPDDAATPPQASPSRARKPGRPAALVLALFAYPLAGAGFYVLGRQRRLVRWIGGGVLLWVLAIVAVRLQLPKLCVFAFAAMVFAGLAALVDTVIAETARRRRRRACS